MLHLNFLRFKLVSVAEQAGLNHPNIGFFMLWHMAGVIIIDLYCRPLRPGEIRRKYLYSISNSSLSVFLQWDVSGWGSARLGRNSELSLHAMEFVKSDGGQYVLLYELQHKNLLHQTAGLQN